MSDSVILELQNLTKSFGSAGVLRGVSLRVSKGEFITLLGPSGCGKTTTLRIIAGLERPDTGRVVLSGRDVTDDEPNMRNVNTVFQNYALFPHMNVEKNIGYGLRIRRVPRREIARRTREMLELVQLPGYEKRMPSQLSGGQRQRVAIARAVILKPDVLLLDEPLGALDLKLRQQMQEELKAIQKSLGITFIYITHDQEEALNMSDRIAIMSNGHFEQIGAPEMIYDHPATRFAARFIGQGAILEGKIAQIDGLVCAVDTSDGRVLAQLHPGQKFQSGANVAVSVHSECIQYTGQPVPGFDLPAVIRSHRYAGSVLRTELILKSGDILIAYSTGMLSSLPGVGTNVYVHWAGRYGALIAEEAES